jgi:phosphatidylinositol alpha-1,6-mannosyltransferase
MADKARERVLVITRNLPPLIGGMERLNWHMIDELARYADVRVIGPAGAANVAPPSVIVREMPLKPLGLFLWSSMLAALREARRFRPHVVLAGSGLTAPAALLASKVAGAAPVAYVHGLDLTANHFIYRRVWLPAIRRMQRVIANSRATSILAHEVGIEAAKVGIVPPGVELPVAESGAETQNSFRKKYRLEERTILLSVGRLSRRKGIMEFVTGAMPLIVRRYPEAVLAIVGDVPQNALHAQSQTPEAIKVAADQAGVGEHVRFLGNLSDAELEVAFETSAVHVFPIRQIPDDPEGFGMVAIEAAAHGIPTVAFAAGGVNDAVAEGESGYLVHPDNYPAMAESVIGVLARKRGMNNTCREFARQFAWPLFGKRILIELQAAKSRAQ